MEEGVQKVNGQEAQVSQALQQALHAGVTDLRHLAGVHHLAEADVNIVAVEAGVRPGSGWVTASVRLGSHVHLSGSTDSEFMFE